MEEKEEKEVKEEDRVAGTCGLPARATPQAGAIDRLDGRVCVLYISLPQMWR